MSEIRDAKIREISAKTADTIDRIILGGLPTLFDIDKLSRVRIHGTNFETWSYEGRPFLELYDPEFENSFDGKSYTVKIVQKHRYLKLPQHPSHNNDD